MDGGRVYWGFYICTILDNIQNVGMSVGIKVGKSMDNFPCRNHPPSLHPRLNSTSMGLNVGMNVGMNVGISEEKSVVLILTLSICRVAGVSLLSTALSNSA